MAKRSGLRRERRVSLAATGVPHWTEWRGLGLVVMNWKVPELARVFVFVLIMASMIALPLVQLSAGADRFGWRMFSQVKPLPEFTVVDSSGDETLVDAAVYTANLRGDIDFGVALPPHLCSVIPDAVAVEVVVQSTESVYDC